MLDTDTIIALANAYTASNDSVFKAWVMFAIRGDGFRCNLPCRNLPYEGGAVMCEIEMNRLAVLSVA